MSKRRKLIAPSILSADFARLGEEIDAIAAAGADWVHVDVMDGHFVRNLTIGAPVVKALKKISPIPLDVHLMIEKPERYVDDFVEAGSDWLTIHVEATRNVRECLAQIRASGVKAGISLRPGTAVEAIFPYLTMVDLILVMTVEPGFGGQSFMMSQLEKIKTLRHIVDHNHSNVLIEVDGGVNAETIAHCADLDGTRSCRIYIIARKRRRSRV